MYQHSTFTNTHKSKLTRNASLNIISPKSTKTQNISYFVQSGIGLVKLLQSNRKEI